MVSPEIWGWERSLPGALRRTHGSARAGTAEARLVQTNRVNGKKQTSGDTLGGPGIRDASSVLEVLGVSSRQDA